MTRLLYLVSHPIQYQAPLLRRLAWEPDLALRVGFQRTDTEQGYFDDGFRTSVRWDVPLRDGYDNAEIPLSGLAAEIAAADVVWLHGWQGTWMRRALGLARRLGKPVLMRAENWDGAMPDGYGLRGVAKRLYLRHLFAHVAAFLAIGSANRAYYRRLGIADTRIFTVPYAVDNAYFAQGAAAADLAALRAELGLPATGQVVLFAGKFQPRKHPELLLEAWRRLPEPRPVLLMVGDGEMREQLRANAPAGVVFTGFRNQSQLPALYALADVFVLPSEREPWGLAVNEAMASGTPVVVSDQVGAAFDLVDENCGAVIPANQTDALADALKRVLADADALGAAAAARVARWDFEADVAGILEAVRHVR